MIDTDATIPCVNPPQTTTAPVEKITIKELTDRHIKAVLQATGNRKSRAADILGINRRTLYRKEREFNKE